MTDKTVSACKDGHKKDCDMLSNVGIPKSQKDETYCTCGVTTNPPTEPTVNILEDHIEDMLAKTHIAEPTVEKWEDKKCYCGCHHGNRGRKWNYYGDIYHCMKCGDRIVEYRIKSEVNKRLAKSVQEAKAGDWWSDWKTVHAHQIGGNHLIGNGSRDKCDECIKRWGSPPLIRRKGKMSSTMILAGLDSNPLRCPLCDSVCEGYEALFVHRNEVHVTLKERFLWRKLVCFFIGHKTRSVRKTKFGVEGFSMFVTNKTGIKRYCLRCDKQLEIL